jgi:hypothetical protein
MHANKLRALFVAFMAIVIAIPMVIHAQDYSPNSVMTAGDIDAVQSQIYYKQQSLKLQALNQKGDGLYSDTTAPNCREVYGSPGNLKVVLVYADGTHFTATTHQSAPGGWTVSSITLDTVLLTRNGKTRGCGFSASAPALQPGFAPPASNQMFPTAPAPGSVPPPTASAN